jgi:site-specific recombinase XerD
VSYQDDHRETAKLNGKQRENLGGKERDPLQKGVRAISVNSYLTCIRAYANWLHAEGYLPEKPKVPLLKCEQKVIGTFSPEQVQKMVAFRPKGTNQTRVHVAACLMLDTGLRLAETLGLTLADADFDNLVVKVTGKGNKQRLVPISNEMRRGLYRHSLKVRGPLLFGTRTGTRVTNRNFQRDFKLLCNRLGIVGLRCSPHTLRHTFAVSYLRAGGNLFYLSRVLGHTSVKTTERYLQSVRVEDLQAVHDRLSPLAPEHLRGARMESAGR